MKKAFHTATYPLVLLAALLLQTSWMRTDMPIGVSVVVTVILVLLGVWALETVCPYTPSWRPTRRLFLLDLGHSLLSANATAQLTKAALAGPLAAIGAALSATLGGSAWPHAWPLWLQLPLAVVIGDFGVYWAHRWMHLSSLGWRLHAVHHSPTKLYSLASGRTHPFNAVLSHGAEVIPLIVLGAGPEVFALWTVFKASNGVLQHANIDLTPGWLNHVIATNEQHWHHHSQAWGPSNSNFGNTTMIWDHLFGSFHTTDERPSTVVGIAGASIPETYLAHMTAPFRLRRYQPGFDQKPERNQGQDGE